MHGRDPDLPSGILPYVAAFLVIVLVLFVAWYLFDRNAHTMSLVLRY